MTVENAAKPAAPNTPAFKPPEKKKIFFALERSIYSSINIKKYEQYIFVNYLCFVIVSLKFNK